MKAIFITCLISLFYLVGCSQDSNVYTLYRSSASDGAPVLRIHIATFDANEKEDYNKGNCEIAQELFQSQPNVSVKFWCEKGRFRK